MLKQKHSMACYQKVVFLHIRIIYSLKRMFKVKSEREGKISIVSQCIDETAMNGSSFSRSFTMDLCNTLKVYLFQVKARVAFGTMKRVGRYKA